MAVEHDQAHDALILLRRSIAANTLPIPSADVAGSTASATDITFAEANFLIFNLPDANAEEKHITIPLISPTRFVSPAVGNEPLDLRSVFFCWLNKDKGIGEYISATQDLNDGLSKLGKNERAINLVFAEKLDLITWLAGEIGEGESEHIRPHDHDRAAQRDADHSAATARGGADIEMRDSGQTDDISRRKEDERLREIYVRERKMGDRNTVLRGIRTQDFSDVRKKYSVLFFNKSRASAMATPAVPQTLNSSPAIRLPIKSPHSGRRPEPIILLSPSASSLLRLPNIKSFLEDGRYTEPESGSSANILHLMRTLPSISSKPLRFIIVDDPSSFRPDYWDRLVAVFTTGQTWQFKHYKWSHPADLFAHALGIFVGYKGEVVPDAVKGWGRGVLSVQIDKGPNRWRDREVVEDVWRGIESNMKARGWGKDLH